MLVMLLLFVALLFVAAVYVVRIYNGLVALRENVRKAWANIDVLLTQRHDELPKLVETCKRYMAVRAGDAGARDAGTLRRLQGAGHAATSPRVGAAEQQLREGLGRLFAVAENYPELKADKSFRHLQSAHHGARGSDRGPPRALQRGGEPEQHPHPDLPGPGRRADVRLQAGALLEFAEEQKRDVDLGKLFG